MSIKSTVNEFKEGFTENYRKSLERQGINYEESLVVTKTVGRIIGGVAIGAAINIARRRSVKKGLLETVKNCTQASAGAVTGIMIVNGVAKEMIAVRRRQVEAARNSQGTTTMTNR